MLGLMARSIAGLAMAMLAGCSLQSTIDAMVSDDDRAMVEDFIEDVREGNLDDLRDEVDPDIWEDSEPQLEQAASLYPEREGETRIYSYSVNSNIDGDGRRTTKEFSAVTTDDDHWTITEIETLAIDGRQRITSWNVEGFDEEPADLEAMEQIGNVMLWGSIIGLLFVIGIVVLIIWLVRRSRRSRDLGPRRGADIGPPPPTEPPAA